MSRSSETGGSLEVLHQERHLQGVHGRGLEVEALVERPGVLVLRVHQHGADADHVGGPGDPQQRVLQKRASDAATVLVAIDRQARQDDDGHRVASKTARHAPRHRFAHHASGGKRVVAHHYFAPADDIALDRFGRLAREREALEPVVEGRLAAVEYA